MTLYVLFVVVKNATELHKHTLTLMQMGSAAATLILFSVLSKIRLQLIDFLLLSTMVIRCIVTFLLFKFSSEQKPGFDNFDQK